VNSAAFSGDGRWVVTANLDKTAKVWDERQWGVDTLESARDLTLDERQRFLHETPH